MTRIFLLAATAISLILPVAAAEAASRHKQHYKHHYRHYPGAWYGPASYAPRPYGWHAPVQLRTPGPPWAMPNECYTDEGYGRFSPCSPGRSR